MWFCDIGLGLVACFWFSLGCDGCFVFTFGLGVGGLDCGLGVVWLRLFRLGFLFGCLLVFGGICVFVCVTWVV